ncbi:MAG: anthranilate phosphoribosyltransferase [Planctomycetota bacterium]
MIEETIGRVTGGDDLTADQMFEVVNQIMDGQWKNEQIGLLLLGMRAKGETVDEVVGAARSLRKNMTKIKTTHTDYVDTCGTGGDGSGTFNISTAAAIVAASAGVIVAKHGNRSITSKSGSSDVLQKLGVNIEASVAQVEKCLNDVGICFCYAPLMHQSMKHVAEVRRNLGVPTIFNMLGPLCNPAEAPYQIMGVGRPELRPLMAMALQSLGIKRAVVVCGSDGLDEVTIGGESYVSLVTPEEITEHTWTPEQFGLTRADKSSLVVDGPDASAERIREIIEGASGPSRDIVVLNAAAAIWTTDPSVDFKDCVERAGTAIDDGSAKECLARLAEVSNSAV